MSERASVVKSDDAMDGLLAALRLAVLEDDRFRVGAEVGRFTRLCGGQLFAQALLAAAATVEGMDPFSVHAVFLAAGSVGDPVELVVRRVRDGRSISCRGVTIEQGGIPIVAATAVFHLNPPAPVFGASADAACDVRQGPDGLPLLSDVVRSLPDPYGTTRAWAQNPPPLEIRMVEPPTFLGGPAGGSRREHWLRLASAVGEDRLLHAALLAYASDYFMLDMAVRAHPARPEGRISASTVDHAIWFHAPVHFDRWHLYQQELVAFTGNHGLVRGTLRGRDGAVVAHTSQAVQVRPR